MNPTRIGLELGLKMTEHASVIACKFGSLLIEIKSGVGLESEMGDCKEILKTLSGRA